MSTDGSPRSNGSSHRPKRNWKKTMLSGIDEAYTADNIRVVSKAATDSVTEMGNVLRAGANRDISHANSLRAKARMSIVGDLHFDSRRAEGDEQLPTASVPLLPDVQLELDDKDAAVVLVFPRKVASDRDVDRPGEMLSQAFRGRTTYLSLAAQEVFDGSRSGCGEQPMGARRYQRVVREELARVLVDAGFRTKTRESIDGDEAFVKVSLPRHGAAIRRMAQTYSYKLPLKRSAYEHVGEIMMANHHGEAPEYVAYTETGLSALLSDFTLKDEILIAKRRLEELLHFNELHSQGVVSQYFAAARYEDVVRLHLSWSNLAKMLLPPYWDTGSRKRPDTLSDCMSGAGHNRMIDDVKDCYGAEVAFFYLWMGWFVQWLLPLAVISLVVATIRRHPAWASALSKSQDQKLCLSFALVLLMWSSLFNKFWQRKQSRVRQAWGITDEATVQTSATAKSYKPSLSGTTRERLMKCLSYTCLLMYVLGFMCLVRSTEPYATVKHSAMQSGMRWQSWLPAFCISIFSSVWTSLVPYVVDLQNHEMQAKWNESLTWFLVPVKMLITVCPFMYILLFRKFVDVETVSADSQRYNELINATQEIFMESGGGCRDVAKNATHLVNFLTQQDFIRWEGGGALAAFSGCLPVACWVRHHLKHADTMNCMPKTECDLTFRLKTDCLVELEEQLLSFYLVHFTSMLAVVVWPIFLARTGVKSKIIKENLKAKETAARPYSFTQFQAACFGLAEYRFNSWGGSWVDNFMQPAIVFLHLQCFSLVAPFLPAVAFVTLLLEYRLMAYRHNNLTCRNWPYASVGIGPWSHIFRYCSWSAVLCIVCKVTLLDDEEKLFDYDLEMLEQTIGISSASSSVNKGIDYKLENFILLLCLVLIFNGAAGLIVSDDPTDVERIRNFNAHVKAKLLSKQEHELIIAQGALKPSLDDVVEMDRVLAAGLDSPSASDSASDTDCGTFSAEDTLGSEQCHLFGARVVC